MKVGILLITYKRTEFLDALISKIEELNLPTIFYQNLSLGNNKKFIEVQNLLYKSLNKKDKFSYINPPKPLSAKDSIIFAINYASNLFDYLLIIEDDICIKKLSKKLLFESVQLVKGKVASVSLYSPYVMNTNSIYDSYVLLKSIYGHSWGWILNSKIWKEFQFDRKNDFFKNIINIKKINFSYRKFAYHNLSFLAEKNIIDTWDYSWNSYCQSKNYYHYKFVPSITKHLGNRDNYATNSKNTIQNDSIQINLVDNQNYIHKGKFLIYSDSKYDLALLKYHHNLSIFRASIIIIINYLPSKMVSIMINFYRRLMRYLRF